MIAKDLDEQLKAIVQNAKSMREAGIARVAIGDVEIELEGLEPPPAPPEVAQASHDDSRGNPIDDPATYGGYIPRRRGADEPREDPDEE